MTTFSERLRSEIDYACISQKDFAGKVGIKKRALDMYLGAQKSMPPADVAVKIAATLGLSVEYLITGKDSKHSFDVSQYLQLRDVLDELLLLPEDVLIPIKAMIKTAANQEREKKKALVSVS